jgi:3-hydroxybutyryl-CoA dehydrogenase
MAGQEAGRLRVAVLGAGRMGAGIAAEYAAAGHAVTVTTSTLTAAEQAVERVHGQLQLLGSAAEVGWARSSAEAAIGADVVVESLPELVEVKAAELAAAQAIAPEAILATNTSSLSLAAIGGSLSDRGRLLGAHYLNPPLAFPVVELVSGPATDPAAVERMATILRSLGKRPVVARDVPGFVLNRLQMALLREALELVDRGVVSAPDLDLLMRDGLGRRWSAIGPFATVAIGGPAVFRRVAEELYPVLSRREDPPASLDRLGLDERAVAELRAARDRALGRPPNGDLPAAPGPGHGHPDAEGS